MGADMILNKYANDSSRWCEAAIHDHIAARILFTADNPLAWFTAGTIAHHALEMYLKSALIVAGLTIAEPKYCPTGSRCAWGHKLPDLAARLAKEVPAFNLGTQLDFSQWSLFFDQPLTAELAFKHFEPFFTELRYPGEYEKFEGIGPDESLMLNALVMVLHPFLPDSTHWHAISE
jgi:hypothetical protein